MAENSTTNGGEYTEATTAHQAKWAVTFSSGSVAIFIAQFIAVCSGGKSVVSIFQITFSSPKPLIFLPNHIFSVHMSNTFANYEKLNEG